MKCALYAIGRLENEYVKEWCDYHLSIGFDHIFIFDNNHDGEEKFEEVLIDLINLDLVTIINARNLINYQNISYSWALTNISANFEWNAFIDIDEFITLNGFNNIKDYLLQTKFDNVDIIHLNWMCYDDNGLIKYEKRNVIDRFPKPRRYDFIIDLKFPENYHVKSLINGKSKYLYNIKYVFNPHSPSVVPSEIICVNNKGEKDEPTTPWSQYDYSEAYIRHYTTKTIEEYLRYKVKRGFCEGAWLNEKLTLEYFFKRNEKTQEKEEFALELINELKQYKNNDK